MLPTIAAVKLAVAEVIVVDPAPTASVVEPFEPPEFAEFC
jgi:hypothetical protein